MGIIWRVLSRPKAMIMGQIACLDANGGYPPIRCRVAFRSYDSPDYIYGTHGFRLAMAAQ